MYTFSTRVRYSEVDYREKVNIRQIVDFFQDCSTFQSEELGGGVEVLRKQNVTWVLANWNIEIKRYPTLGEEIIVGTYPYSFHECFGMRNYFIKDSKGEIIAMADSLWTLIDYEKGSITRITDEIKNIYELEEKLDMDYRKGRIKIPKELTQKEEMKAYYHNIDSNEHVNNAQYLDMALDILDKKDYSKIRVEYRKQMRQGEKIYLFAGKNELGDVVVLRNEEMENGTILEFIE